MASEAQEKTKDCYIAKCSIQSYNRDEIRSADLALISGRQMHRINARIFLVAITKNLRQLSEVFLLCLSDLIKPDKHRSLYQPWINLLYPAVLYDT